MNRPRPLDDYAGKYPGYENAEEENRCHLETDIRRGVKKGLIQAWTYMIITGLFFFEIGWGHNGWLIGALIIAGGIVYFI